MRREEGILLQRHGDDMETRAHFDHAGWVTFMRWQRHPSADAWGASHMPHLSAVGLAALTAELRRREGGEAGK